MKTKYIAVFSFIMCILSGCGEKVGQASYSSETSLEVIATSPIETAVPTEAQTTVPASEPNHAKPDGAILTVNDAVEVFETLTVSELLTDTNVQLENKDEIINTDHTGSFETTVTYTYEGVLYEHTISYNVMDSTPPIPLNSGSGSYIIRGSSFDLNDYVGYADNYDPSPSLSYTGQVDTSVCGTYPLTAFVTDSSGNETSWELNINVVDEIPSYEDNNARLSFDNFRQQYAGDNVSFGIDVSKWQGDIDFEAVRNAGCSFVIMRMGHYYDEITMDQYYKQNMEKARAAGLDVGVYIYTTANTEEEIKENAHWIAQQLNGQELDFPVVFDWEDFTNFQQYEMSIHDLNHLFEVFADEMKKYGYPSMLYSSKNFLNNFWYEHSNYPVWLAHYTDQTDYAGEYVMWQMSCFGKIDGIAGDVDLNILYNDKFTAQ